MREAHILIVDDYERHLAGIEEVLHDHPIHIDVKRNSGSALEHVSEHRLTDMAVINPHANWQSQRALLEVTLALQDDWRTPVILYSPPTDEHSPPRARLSLALYHKRNKILDTQQAVLAEIAFLTRILHNIRPIALKQEGPQLGYGRYGNQQVGNERNYTAHIGGISPDARLKFEHCLTMRDAKKWLL